MMTNDRQLGFKKHSSTQVAGFIFKEVANKYMSKKSKMHAAFLDISKAFDKVCHVKLFRKLRERGIDKGLMSLIHNWYGGQNMSVKFDNVMSDSWLVKNGIRQGGILSPDFFAVYIDELLNKICKLNVGCKLDIVMLNIIAYADDLVIMAPTAYALQKILNLIGTEMMNLKLNLNVAKCVYMIFSKKRSDELPQEIYLCNQSLTYVKEFKYLGFVFDDSLTNKKIL